REEIVMTRHVSRRAFLGTTTAPCVAPVLNRLADPGFRTSGTATTPKLILGVASYSFREFPLDRALAMAKTLGVTHMTFKNVHLPRTDRVDGVHAGRAGGTRESGQVGQVGSARGCTEPRTWESSARCRRQFALGVPASALRASARSRRSASREGGGPQRQC